MANQIWTRIAIGGAVDPAGVDAIIEALFDDFFGYDTTPDEAVRATIRNNEPLIFTGNCTGDPEITIAVCQARGLTYTCSHDSGHDWDAGGLYWTPGMAQPEEFACSSSFRPVMHLKEIREKMAAGTLAAHLEDLEIWSGGKSFPALKLIEEVTRAVWS